MGCLIPYLATVHRCLGQFHKQIICLLIVLFQVVDFTLLVLVKRLSLDTIGFLCFLQSLVCIPSRVDGIAYVCYLLIDEVSKIAVSLILLAAFLDAFLHHFLSLLKLLFVDQQGCLFLITE